MSVLNRFRRTSIWSLEVGDVIRFRVLHQSRTGYIAQVRGKGRIETLDRHQTTEPGVDPYVEGLLQDRSGIMQPFKLTEHETVYRRATARSRAPRPQRATPVADQPGSDPRPRRALN